MNQLERNKAILSKYIPEAAVDTIAEWIYRFDFKLRIKRSRSSKYADYFPPVKGNNHQITINRDLNPYAFLITLIHEIAHLTNWEKHGHKVKPHGKEWKHEYKVLIQPFMNETVFPADVIHALQNYMKNPAASSCSDLSLFRTLKKYDDDNGLIFLEELPHGTIFKINKERYFVKGKKARTRYQCEELKTKRMYLFNPLAEVTLVREAIGKEL